MDARAKRCDSTMVPPKTSLIQKGTSARSAVLLPWNRPRGTVRVPPDPVLCCGLLRHHAARTTLEGAVLARLPGKLGTYYRGGQGQWAWALHRITGVGVLAFLFVHIADTALVGFGPKYYNSIVRVYHNPVIRLLEIGLALMVLFHALNGLRIIIIDFWPKMADYHKQLFQIVLGLYVVLATPAVFFMGREFIRSVTHGG